MYDKKNIFLICGGIYEPISADNILKREVQSLTFFKSFFGKSFERVYGVQFKRV